jgi:hypothetical protein
MVKHAKSLKLTQSPLHLLLERPGAVELRLQLLTQRLEPATEGLLQGLHVLRRELCLESLYRGPPL